MKHQLSLQRRERSDLLDRLVLLDQGFTMPHEDSELERAVRYVLDNKELLEKSAQEGDQNARDIWQAFKFIIQSKNTEHLKLLVEPVAAFRASMGEDVDGTR